MVPLIMRALVNNSWQHFWRSSTYACKIGDLVSTISESSVSSVEKPFSRLIRARQLAFARLAWWHTVLWKDGERVGNLKPASRLEPDPLLSTLPPSPIVLLLIGENLRGGFVEYLGWCSTTCGKSSSGSGRSSQDYGFRFREKDYRSNMDLVWDARIFSTRNHSK